MLRKKQIHKGGTVSETQRQRVERESREKVAEDTQEFDAFPEKETNAEDPTSPDPKPEDREAEESDSNDHDTESVGDEDDGESDAV
jgi:hypothetical protein